MTGSKRLGIARRALLSFAPPMFATSIASAQLAPDAPAPTPSAAPAQSAAPVSYNHGDEVEVIPSGHAALGIGGAVGGPNAGFRLGLDASLGVALGTHSDRGGAWTLAPSIITGFGKYPTYTTLDFGRLFAESDAMFGALTGAAATIGPAVRVDRNVGAGGEASLRFWLVVLQVGVRAVAIVTNDAELQIEATVGLGLF